MNVETNKWLETTENWVEKTDDKLGKENAINDEIAKEMEAVQDEIDSIESGINVENGEEKLSELKAKLTALREELYESNNELLDKNESNKKDAIDAKMQELLVERYAEIAEKTGNPISEADLKILKGSWVRNQLKDTLLAEMNANEYVVMMNYPDEVDKVVSEKKLELPDDFTIEEEMKGLLRQYK